MHGATYYGQRQLIPICLCRPWFLCVAKYRRILPVCIVRHSTDCPTSVPCYLLYIICFPLSTFPYGGRERVSGTRQHPYSFWWSGNLVSLCSRINHDTRRYPVPTSRHLNYNPNSMRSTNCYPALQRSLNAWTPFCGQNTGRI